MFFGVSSTNVIIISGALAPQGFSDSLSEKQHDAPGLVARFWNGEHGRRLFIEPGKRNN